MSSKHSKALRRQKRKAEGVTYKLVHPSYEDKNYGEAGHAEVEWVKEADLNRNHRGHNSRQDKLNLDDIFHTDEGKGLPSDDDWEDLHGGAVNNEGGDYSGSAPSARGRCLPKPGEAGVRSNNSGGEEVFGDAHMRVCGTKENTKTKKIASSAARSKLLCRQAVDGDEARIKESEKYMHKRNMLMMHHEEDVSDDDKLFEDEIETEVTDDFIRQLVFGTGEEAKGVDKDFSATAGRHWGGDISLDESGAPYGIDDEAWRLLTEEEKSAFRASKRHGVAHRLGVLADDTDKRAEGIHESPFNAPSHAVQDITQCAMDRQFTAMMQEFNADVHINDAYTDDFRTHGPLSMDKYLGALEEFATERAGVDYETTEPSKNKGFIQQLKMLSHRAGVFDADSQGGMYLTTLPSEKHKRFAMEFKHETERIREEARLRLQKKAVDQETASFAELQQQHDTEEGDVVRADRASSDDERQEEEAFDVIRVTRKGDCLDCETAVSEFSTYFNQPNVIYAPAAVRKKKKNSQLRYGKAEGALRQSSDDTTRRGDDGADRTYGGRDGAKEAAALNQASFIDPSVRPKGETAEEKQLRRQAIKAAHRERRQEKSALKKAYHSAASDEMKRVAMSQAAKRTVHFW